VKEPYSSEDLVLRFIKEMNKFGAEIGLEQSNFAVCHGLMNKNNISTARDIGFLSCLAMKNESFKSIVATSVYSCSCYQKNNQPIEVEWINTNKLLDKGFEGLKTGITDSAGPCLSTSLRVEEIKVNGVQLNIVAVVFNSKSVEHRWTECKMISKWALS